MPAMAVTPWQPFKFPSLGNWDEAVAAVLAHVQGVEGLQPSTYRWIRTSSQSFRTFLIDAKHAREFFDGDLRQQVSIVETWIAALRDRGLSRMTLETYWRGLHALCRRLGESDSRLNPLDWMKRPKVGPRIPRALTPAEAARLVQFVQQHPWRSPFEATRNVAIIACMLLAGLRRGEVLRLRYGDVDLVGETLAIVQSKGPNGGKDRTAYLPPQLKEFLAAYVVERVKSGRVAPPLFLSTVVDSPIGVSTIQRLFAVIEKETGLHVWPHLLRHTAAALMHRAGIAPRVGMDLMGHAHLSTFESYGRVFDADHHDAAQRLRLDLGA